MDPSMRQKKKGISAYSLQAVEVQECDHPHVWVQGHLHIEETVQKRWEQHECSRGLDLKYPDGCRCPHGSRLTENRPLRLPLRQELLAASTQRIDTSVRVRRLVVPAQQILRGFRAPASL
jgi:hypothetical protein